MKRFIYLLLIILMLIPLAYSIQNDSSLVSHWKMENLTDSSGHGHTLTNNGASSTGTGCWEGNCYDFDGITDYMNIATHSDYSFGTDSLTLSAWVETDDITKGGGIITKIDASNTNPGFRIFMRTDGDIDFVIGDVSTYIQSTFNKPISNNVLTHVAVVFNRSSNMGHLYYNGVSVGNLSIAGISGNSITTAQDLIIGRQGTVEFDGTIDEVSIWRDAKTKSEVIDIYTNGINYSIAPNPTPQIQLNISDGQFFNYQPINILMNTTSIVNMSIYYNGTLNQTFLNTNSTSATINLFEGSNPYQFKSEDTNGINYNNITIYLDSFPANVSVNSLTEWNIGYNITDLNTTLNITCEDPNIQECEIHWDDNTTTDLFNVNYKNFATNGNHSFILHSHDLANNTANASGIVFINPYQYFYFEDPSTNPISNFTFGGNNYNNYAAIKIYDLGFGDQNLSFVKYGYATTSVTFNLNTTSEINITTEIPIALLYISIYDVDTLALINQQVDIDLIGDNFAGSFSTSNGSITILNITDLPDTYELDLSSSGYEDLTYYFQHTGYAAVELSLYMQNTSTTIPIKYIILDTFGDPYDLTTCLVELQIYQISSNSYESFVMDYTNSIAEVIFNLDTTQKYKPIVTCGDQTQVYDGGKITSTPVYLKFSQASLDVFPTVPTISSVITFVELSNTSGRFKFTYNDLNNIISQACLNVTVIDYATETFVGTQCLSSSSGSINVDFSTTAGLTYKAYGFVKYEGQFYEVDTYYKKIPHAEFDFGIWGVIFGLVIVGLLAIGGFFMGKAKGVLVGTTAGLWIMSLSIFGVWYMPVSAPLIAWSVLLIVGLIFS